LFVLTFALGCEEKPDPPQVAPAVAVQPRPAIQPLPVPVPVPVPRPVPAIDYTTAAKAALAAQDPSPQFAGTTEPNTDTIAAMKAALAAQDQQHVPAASPTQAVSAQASTTWERTFQQPPVKPQLVPLNREQFEELTKYNRMPVKNLPPALRPLASNCPELSTLTVKLISEGLGAVTDGTKAELPIQLLTGIGEIVVEEKKAEICGFLIGRLQ
jgi:hypothetical protein